MSAHAQAIHVPATRTNDSVNGKRGFNCKRGITVGAALRLARATSVIRPSSG